MADIILIMRGGLGNQLFEYACARSLQLKYGYNKIIMDISELKRNDMLFELGNFNLPRNIYNICLDNRYWRYSRLRNLFLRFTMHYFPNLILYWGKERNIFIWDGDNYIGDEIGSNLDLDKNLVLSGYWQSEKYFKDNIDIIKDELDVRSGIEHISNNYLKRIRKSNATCIHVRLGDYLKGNRYSTFGPEYYRKAIEMIKINECFQDNHFFVFSNDIRNARKIINYRDLDMDFVEYEGQNAITDFFLMQQCDNFIMANSTYSWWAQYLGKKKRTVIAPKTWTINNENRDLYSNNWILI